MLKPSTKSFKKSVFWKRSLWSLFLWFSHFSKFLYTKHNWIQCLHFKYCQQSNFQEVESITNHCYQNSSRITQMGSQHSPLQACRYSFTLWQIDSLAFEIWIKHCALRNWSPLWDFYTRVTFSWLQTASPALTIFLMRCSAG